MSLTKAQLLNMQGEKDSARILLHDCVSNGKLTRAQKCKALQTLFHLELFLLNFDASRAALRSLIETSTEQHLNLILQDQQDIFESNAHDLRSYQGVRDIETLCRLHLDKTNLRFGTGICSASWMFMNKIGQMRSWWSLSFKAILEHMSATPKIPRIIVQYWDQDKCSHGCRDGDEKLEGNYPEFNHVLIISAARSCS